MRAYSAGMFALLVSTGLTSLPGIAQQPSDPASSVNPFIGTTNGGNVFPGATVPFGMVQFSPEASPFRPGRPIAAPGGYEYRATKLRGFSLTNVEGWGCAGGSGDVPMMPVTEAVGDSPSLDFRNAYAAGFTHADEQAHPGYYSVKLANGVQVELTASTRTGSALFHFPSDKTGCGAGPHIGFRSRLDSLRDFDRCGTSAGHGVCDIG